MLRLGDMVRAVVELGFARARLAAKADSAKASLNALSPEEERLVERVAYVIPRVAARVPWRADCLIQAHAAQRWLTSAGITSDLHFGVPKVKPPVFEAHAWLTVGDRVVTGGDIRHFTPFVRP